MPQAYPQSTLGRLPITSAHGRDSCRRLWRRCSFQPGSRTVVRSGLTWLSSSSAEIARARSVLDALRKPGVIDELGFLMLNGAFAERLYPGVTTIMTRARYIVFVPAVYRYLEQSRHVVGKNAEHIARSLQFDLRNALAKNEDSFIGRDKGFNVIRT